MSRTSRGGIPVARDESSNLQINTDGSLDVRSKLQELFGQAPVRSLLGLTATQIVASNDNRRSLDVFNNDVTIVYIGVDNTVSIINGVPLLPYNWIGWDGYKGELWGISTVVGTDTRVLEMLEDG